jgi:phosphoglycerol transferase MdoB-like AlkP superfamily enzyme
VKQVDEGTALSVSSGRFDGAVITRVIPERYRSLLLLGLVFLAVNALVRAGLLAFDGELGNLAPGRLLGIFGFGVIYDLAALSWLLIPFVLLAWAVPTGKLGRLVHGVLSTALLTAVLIAMAFTAASEGVFWNEFSSRFNFIAVDYLIYTREVVGNIRQSYPLGLMLTGVGLSAAVLAWLVVPRFWRHAGAYGGGWRRRSLVSLGLLCLPVLSFMAVGDQFREQLATPSARELAGNGYYDFMRAFRSNDLDYRVFYRNLPLPQAQQILRRELVADAITPVADLKDPVLRRIQPKGARREHNVVLVSMESLGADYVESFGGRPGLTPNLDRLGREGLVFNQLYATGLRTVRGLEALTLSIPPTPGHAVPMRKNNKGFQTLGGVLAGAGYEPLYIYGGYSQFDNMQDFFGGNGYTVIDRSAIPSEAISHETIWGVADEDLFKLSIREIDKRVASGRKVFAHVMTTSNHRPFTFPDGRIDLRSGSGRDAAVKYSDWAIGQLVREASTYAWFHNTVFVFVADHTSNGRGRTDLPPENFRIPMIVYAPGIVQPGRVDLVGSQIDVAPTLLGMLNIGYTSHFFGHDLLGDDGVRHQRALMANYLTVGYMQDGVMVSLSPKQRVQLADAQTGKMIPNNDPRAAGLTEEAIAYYQVATEQLRGRLQNGGSFISQARASSRH